MVDVNDIFSISSEQDFEKIAIQVFNFQFENNKVYRSYCDLLFKHPSDIRKIEDIPFLPIQFFKSHEVVSSFKKSDIVFTSSGTTNTGNSRHFVTELSIYNKSFLKGFELFYGDPSDYTILALLPSYLERDGSSLIYMVEALINKSKNKLSGFYLHNYDDLIQQINSSEKNGEKILLIGVTYALLDLIEQHQFNLKNTIIMETGGMKGKRKELIREELHKLLKNGFGVNNIHSEYGMTELLSQAYSKGYGIFQCSPWMKILTRSVYNPLETMQDIRSGGLNIIDLANINSCSFIATQDLGKVYPDGSFEVIGRFDSADIRGCNLMVL
ncbi:long-chain-fatty-acid--protein ligase [Aegicerativicinus sediminis]|uniref:acyl transferase n=1 Tax=Aegicerativicinus sediminis TaxID=2893202 RepID=UPI001E60D217|nr:acyl transferase [Aegicerativicinus sediminis]